MGWKEKHTSAPEERNAKQSLKKHWELFPRPGRGGERDEKDPAAIPAAPAGEGTSGMGESREGTAATETERAAPAKVAADGISGNKDSSF